MIPFSLYNSETRTKEIIPIQPHRVLKIYTCGPTVYHFAHIGNFRTYVFEDLLRRSLLFFGFAVEQVMNLTDLDDKTIRGAVEAGVALHEFTAPFQKAFFDDLALLNIAPVEHYPTATSYIPQMIALIETLIDKGYAYRGATGSIYFSIRKFPRYGRLSHLILSELKVNASGDHETDEYEKGEAADFVLWKIYDPQRDGSIFWESPFGPGRPGWHIECSVMALSLLGETVDLHCGGVDNRFPHHENEIAQSEGCTGHLFVRHWVHVEHLLVDHKKMSKSLGNFYTLRDLCNKGYSGREVRYLLLATHYRTPLNFTFQGLEAARHALARIDAFLGRLSTLPSGEGPSLAPLLDEADQQLRHALADDLNISVALAVLFELIHSLHRLADQGKVFASHHPSILTRLRRWDQLFAFLFPPQESVPLALLQKLSLREKARKEKNFALSDQIRQELFSLGYWIEDTPQGARLRVKPPPRGA